MDSSLIRKYRNFLDNGKTERECVNEIIKLAEAEGFRNVSETSALKAGDKVYFQVYGKSIALFQIGSGKAEDGMNILGAHIDSPRLDIKMKPLYESDGIVYLDTHYYGGIKKYQWVTIPLAIHGVVAKKDGSVINVTIGEDDESALCISDILPHIAQDQMKKTAAEAVAGEDLDIIVGLSDDRNGEEKEKGKKTILSVLEEKYGIAEDDFLSAELEAVPAGKSKLMGLDGSMVLAYGQDDRICAFTSLEAILHAEPSERTLCCVLVDKEEIGSTGSTGMDSVFFENAVSEVLSRMSGGYDSMKLRRMLMNSYMLSSDVNSAYDPLNASKMDEYKVPFQMAELAKVDVGGGGTIAKYAAYYGMSVIDAGVAVMSMHAPWEITAAKDVEYATSCYKAFLTM